MLYFHTLMFARWRCVRTVNSTNLSIGIETQVSTNPRPGESSYLGTPEIRFKPLVDLCFAVYLKTTGHRTTLTGYQ